jgi:hypothetical protein
LDNRFRVGSHEKIDRVDPGWSKRSSQGVRHHGRRDRRILVSILRRSSAPRTRQASAEGHAHVFILSLPSLRSSDNQAPDRGAERGRHEADLAISNESRTSHRAGRKRRHATGLTHYADCGGSPSFCERTIALNGASSISPDCDAAVPAAPSISCSLS